MNIHAPTRNTSTGGFTLIELLVVISIIGLLSSVVFASLSTARVKARNARRVADLKQLSIALDLYFDSSNSYPNSQGGSGPWDGIYTCWGDSSGASNPSGWINGLAPAYIPLLPLDPRNHTVCGEQYIYQSNSVDYKLISHSPEDCEGAAKLAPSFKDPARDGGSNGSVVDGNSCWSIGIWTSGAVAW